VFEESFLGWLGVLKDQGYCPMVVVFRNSDRSALVEALVDRECGLWVQSDWSNLAREMPGFEGEEALVGFVDGRVTGTIG
jgi:hypothetical protein